MSETYENDAENAMPQPAWLRALRAMIFVLTGVTILAMGAVGWAAIRLVNEATAGGDPLENLYHSDMLPDGTSLVSVSRAGGGILLIYAQSGVISGRYYDSEGVLQSEQVFE